MNNPTNVTTGKVRLSYVHLFQPYAVRPGQEAKYSTTILIPKSDAGTKQRIDAAIQAAIEVGIPKVWGGTRPPQPAIPIHDGDGPRPSDGVPFGEECKGHWVMNASSKQQQAVVDLGLNPIIDQSEIYSGMYARVNVNFFPYNNTKKGIGCGLGPVQKLEDGEPLGGGRISPEQAFGAPIPPTAAPMQQQQLAYPQYAPQQPYVQPVQQQPQYTPAQYQGRPAAPTQPVYPQPQGVEPNTGEIMGAGYPQQPAAPQYAPQQPAYPQQQPTQTLADAMVDPITGKPVGGILGI